MSGAEVIVLVCKFCNREVAPDRTSAICNRCAMIMVQEIEKDSATGGIYRKACRKCGEEPRHRYFVYCIRCLAETRKIRKQQRKKEEEIAKAASVKSLADSVEIE